MTQHFTTYPREVWQRCSTAMLFVLLIVGSSLPHAASARDGQTLAPIPPDSMQAAPLVTYPADIFSENDFNAVQAMVNESRGGGAPLAVRVVNLPDATTAPDSLLAQFASVDVSAPIPDATMDEIAGTLAINAPVETSPGADDGFLLVVVVTPHPDNSRATWHVGDNAMPLNGFSRENLAAVITGIESGLRVGSPAWATYNGLIEFSYLNQFGDPDREPKTNLVRQVGRIANIPLAAAVIVSALAIPGIIFWSGRRKDTAPSELLVLDPLDAASLHLGRVSPAVIAAAVVDRMEAGLLVRRSNGALAIPEVAPTDSLVRMLPAATDAATQNGEAAGIVVQSHASARLPEALNGWTRLREDELMRAGLFDPMARTRARHVAIAIVVCLLLSGLTVIPAVIGQAQWAIAAVLVAVAIALLGWRWIATRSWTTAAGHRALERWLGEASATDLNLYEAAARQGIVLDTIGGPQTSAETDLLRAVQGLGHA